MRYWYFVLFGFSFGCKLDTSGDLTRDADGDGFSVVDGDCDDNEASAYPGSPEVPYDAIDQDCDGTDLTDVDQDGFDAEAVGGSDCDDQLSGVNPGVDDVWYDGIDSDCDGSDDFDQDHDGYVPDYYVGEETQYVSASGSLPGGDCDDEVAGINPGEEDTWYDGEDSDCDGASDYDQDGDGYDSDAYDGLDCDDLDADVNPDAEEVAGDGVDNDCFDDLPVIDSLELSLEELYTDSVLMALVEASDPDGDPVELEYAWYVDGVLAEATGDLLASSAFERDQLVYVKVTPSSTDQEGASETSELLTVQNSPPVIDDLELSSLEPYEGDTLTVMVTASDADDDELVHSYRWLVDGVEVEDSAELGSGWFDKHQEVQVEVISSDGTDSSTAVTSALAVVQNTPPEILSVELDFSELYTDDEVTVTATATDADGDDVTFAFAWSVDSIVVSETGTSLDGATWFDKGQTVRVEVTPSDDDEDGAALSSDVLDVLNSAPTEPVVGLNPSNPVPGYDDMICEVTTASTDADGDSISYSFAWTQDGAAYTGASTTTHTGDTVRGGAMAATEVWECTVTPSDGTDDGPDASVSVAVGCDDDDDGYLSLVCSGMDCDDNNATINPDATDTWYDGVDQDCDGWSDFDADGDGHDSDAYGGDDCDDTDATMSPSAIEIWYDGVDQDCGGGSDYDADVDGYNATSWGGLDCDDSDASVNPDAEEVCDSGVDNDCDGIVDFSVPTVYSTIQDAIDAASDGDIVCVDTGTYYENIDFSGKSIHVLGILGSGYTSIDGGGVDTVVSFMNQEDEDAILEGFTITNGYGDLGDGYGGGLTIGEYSYSGWRYPASPTLIDLVVTQNTGGDAGGAFVLGSPTFENVEFSENSGFAGAVYVHAQSSYVVSSPVFSSVDFVGNISESGDQSGAVYLESATGEFSDVVFSENVGGFTGAVTAYCDGLHPGLVISDAIFEDNTGTYSGGIYVSACSTAIENASFVGNEGTASDSEAGALYLYQQYYEVTTIENVEFRDNTASKAGAVGLWGSGHTFSFDNTTIVGNTGGYGGGIRGYSAALEMDNSVVSGNTATYEGGGLLVYYGSATLRNVVVTENTSSFASGGGISCDSGASLSYSDVWGNYPDDFYGFTDPTGSDGNVSTDPLFLDTSSSSAADWDVHLSSTSPLIDAGDPSLTDPDGSTSDIGAYGGTGAELWDLDGDGYPAWWQPGAYDSSTYPALGLDCDDSDADVYPGSGC